MGDESEEKKHDASGIKSGSTGLLIGVLAGAASMLLFAPQSGKRTRAQIRAKGTQLRDRTVEIANSAVEQVRSETHELSTGVREKAGRMKELGQDELVKQLDRVSAALDAGKKVVKDA